MKIRTVNKDQMNAAIADSVSAFAKYKKSSRFARSLLLKEMADAIAVRRAEIISVMKGPLVLCGDMNIFGGTKELAPLMKETGLMLPPDVPLTEPSPEHLVAKRAFEVDRLRSWFGQ